MSVQLRGLLKQNSKLFQYNFFFKNLATNSIKLAMSGSQTNLRRCAKRQENMTLRKRKITETDSEMTQMIGEVDENQPTTGLLQIKLL